LVLPDGNALGLRVFRAVYRQEKHPRRLSFHGLRALLISGCMNLYQPFVGHHLQ
jgi:hypothetical protein